jgi:protein phosphatase
LYLVRDGKLVQLTEDHSVVQEMVRSGLLTDEQASRHDDRNLVTRSLGVHKKVEVGIREEPFLLRSGDQFLLCSDGLTDVLTSADLLSAIQSVPVDIACKSLISEANRRGASDNVSAIVLTLTEPGSAGKADLAPTREFHLSKDLRETR